MTKEVHGLYHLRGHGVVRRLAGDPEFSISAASSIDLARLERKKGEEQMDDLLPHHLPPLYRNYFTSLLLGERVRPAKAEIRGAVAIHFLPQPMTVLSSAETMDLKRDMAREYQKRFENKCLVGIAGPVYLMPANEPHPLREDNPYFNRLHMLYLGDADPSLAITPLTPKQKEVMLTDPWFYENVELAGDDEMPFGFLAYGTRNLLEKSPNGGINDDYGFTGDSFRSLLATVRDAQGKDPTDTLHGLDVGGSTGLAAHDAEQIDPYLMMTNLTMSAEMAAWPLRGGHVLQQAEYLPASMREQYDVLLSNWTFPYMRFPDIALMNSIHALRTGGILDLSFGFFNSPLVTEGRTSELFVRLQALMPRLAALQESGKIVILPTFTKSEDDVMKHWQETGKVDIGQFCIQKKASLD